MTSRRPKTPKEWRRLPLYKSPYRLDGVFGGHRDGRRLWTEDTTTWAVGPVVGRRLACLGVDFALEQRQQQARHQADAFFKTVYPPVQISSAERYWLDHGGCFLKFVKTLTPLPGWNVDNIVVVHVWRLIWWVQEEIHCKVFQDIARCHLFAELASVAGYKPKIHHHQQLRLETNNVH